MPNRPWLLGAAHDKYSTPNMVHFDLFAWSSHDGYVYFEMIVTASGVTPLAYGLFRSCATFGVWDALALDQRPNGLVPHRWTRATHDDFKRAHARLLALCVIPEGFARRTVLAHYVKPYDGDPWPRGFLNTWTPLKYADGKRPGRPKRNADSGVNTTLDGAEII